MIQYLDTVGQQFLTNLQTLTGQIATTQAQVSSGYQITQPSDNPAEVGDVLQLESELGQVNQVSANLTQVQGQVNTAESALESAANLMEQASTIAAQGASTTTSAASRATLSQEVQQILSQLVSISNTQFDGQYVFSGSDATQPPYQLDLTQPNGVDQLVTAQATTQIQDATGVTFGIAETAQQIFDNRNPDGSLAANNVFAAVNSLQAALANNDQNGINNAVNSIQTASDYLNQQLAYYGSVQDQVSNAVDVAQKFQLQYQTALGQETDTDMATAAVTLQQENTSMQAAVQAEASLPTITLFDLMQANGG